MIFKTAYLFLTNPNKVVSTMSRINQAEASKPLQQKKMQEHHILHILFLLNDFNDLGEMRDLAEDLKRGFYHGP